MSKISAELSAVFLRTRFHDPGVPARIRLWREQAEIFICTFRFFFSFFPAVVSYRISAAEGEVFPRAGKIVEIEINGSINPSTVDYIKTALSEARAQDAKSPPYLNGYSGRTSKFHERHSEDASQFRSSCNRLCLSQGGDGYFSGSFHHAFRSCRGDVSRNQHRGRSSRNAGARSRKARGNRKKRMISLLM